MMCVHAHARSYRYYPDAPRAQKQGTCKWRAVSLSNVVQTTDAHDSAVLVAVKSTDAHGSAVPYGYANVA